MSTQAIQTGTIHQNSPQLISIVANFVSVLSGDSPGWGELLTYYLVRKNSNQYLCVKMGWVSLSNVGKRWVESCTRSLRDLLQDSTQRFPTLLNDTHPIFTHKY